MKVGHVQLGSILTQKKTRTIVDPDATYPIAGVLGFGRGLLLRQPIRGTETKYNWLTELGPNDVVYSKVKAFEGAFAVVDDWGAGTYVSPEFPVFTPNALADPRFLRHYLASEQFASQVKAMSTGVGARRERVNPDRFLTAKIPLPELPDQRRIAVHLDSVATTSIYARESLSRYRSVLPALAYRSGGETVHVGDLVRRATRPRAVESTTQYVMAGVRWYGGGLFVRDRILGQSLAASTVYDVLPGDLVYNRLFAWKESFAIARESGWTVSNEFPTFEINTDLVLPEVLLGLLLTPEFTQQVDQASTGSTPTSRNRLKEEAFARLTVDLPAREHQEGMARIHRDIHAARQVIERSEALALALLSAARNEVFSQLR